ncbi:MAG: fibronectin type III domain-containing protein [Gemmatimonadales bacterium]
MRSAALLLAAAALAVGCGDPASPSLTIAAPTGLTVQELPSGDFEVSWQDNSSNEDSFELDRSSTGAGGTYALLATLATGASTYQDTQVDGVTSYCYRVRAVGPSGTTPSGYTAAECLQAAAPAAPSGLTATPTFGQVDLSWTDASSDEASFEIWRSVTGAGGTFALVNSVAAGVTTYSSTSLLDGTAYCYRVRAIGAKGQGSDFSNTACATTPVPVTPPPTAPSGLAALASSATAIDLTWNDNSADEQGFEIWRSTTGAGGTYSLLQSVAANATSSSDAGLASSTAYCYQVRATGAGDAPPSAFTASACATTPAPPPPGTPSGLAAAATSTTAIALTWNDNSSNESGFEVWRSTTGAAGAFTLLKSVAANATGTNDTGLTAGAQYCYQVRAAGSGSVPPSAFSNTSCATPPAALTAPTDVSAAATSTTAIALTWTDNSTNEQSFEIWRSTSGLSGTYSLLSTVAANTTSSSNTGLTAGTQYCYKVKAIGAGIVPSSPLSAGSCATTATPVVAPSGLAATATSTTAIALAWTDNSANETGFEVWRSTTGSSGTYTLLTTVAAGATSANDTGLAPGTPYCYKVKALGGGITPSSAFSNNDCATTGAQLAAPTSLAASATSSTAIALGWTDNSSNETGFEVWRSTSGPAGTFTLLKSVAANATSTSDNGLTVGTQYCYQVRALGSGINPTSAFSSTDCATTLAPPATPANLGATAGSTSQIDLTWQDLATDEGGYEVWRSTTGSAGTYTLRSARAANSTSYSDTGLSPSTQYCYEVKATGAGNAPDSPFTSAACATTLTPVTVRIVLFGDSNTDRCEEDWISVPPNPSRKASYVSVTPHLSASDPNLSCSVPGKVEADWEALRPNPITVVNHAIASTTTGGNTHVAGDPDRASSTAPNARLSVGGFTRFEGEVLGKGYPWSGGETMNSSFPSAPVLRVNAFTPGPNDFAYVSMGTNDDAGVTRTLTAAQTEANLRWMAQKWIDAGRSPDHFIITTLAPRDDANSATSISVRNTLIRTLASDLGLHLIELAGHVSDDNGATWRDASLNIGDGIHYTETVRGWLSDQIVAWMDSKTP